MKEMPEEYFVSLGEGDDLFGPLDEKMLERWKRMAAREGLTPWFGRRLYVCAPILPRDGRPKPFRECAFTRTADLAPGRMPRIKAKVRRRVLLILLALAGLAAAVGALAFVLKAV